LIVGTVSDADAGALEGIALTGMVSGTGTWQYSLDAGATWSAVGAVSDSSALLLRDSDRLRFVPDGANGSTASVSFRAWDLTTGSPGVRTDATVNGGITAFSAATATAPIIVASVNDAPVLSGADSFTGITEDDINNPGAMVSDLVANSVTDVDSGSLKGIAV